MTKVKLQHETVKVAGSTADELGLIQTNHCTAAQNTQTVFEALIRPWELIESHVKVCASLKDILEEIIYCFHFFSHPNQLHCNHLITSYKTLPFSHY